MPKQLTFWTPARKKALEQVFEGRKTLDDIALNCAVSPRTLDAWIAHAAFQEQLHKLRENLIAALDHKPYIRKERRLAALADMAESARREYEARPWLQEIRPTPNGEIVNESFNRDAHAAFRDALNDIARELGERSSNVNITATQQSLNVTLIMERMHNDPGYAERANELARLIAGAGDAGSDHQ